MKNMTFVEEEYTATQGKNA